MEEKKYTTGEIAKISGLTIRTVQYYGNIGLLPPSGRSENDRRFYTDKDLIQLEQIMLYKLLGFPLSEIKDVLLISPDEEELLKMLESQQLLLLEKIEQLNTSFISIDIISKIIKSGKQPPFHVLLQSIGALPKDNLLIETPKVLSSEENNFLSEQFKDINIIQDFYNGWKKISIEANILIQTGVVLPRDDLAQDLAKRWWKMILKLTGGNKEMLVKLSQFDLGKRLHINDSDIMGNADKFIQDSCDIYLKNNNIDSDFISSDTGVKNKC